MGILTLTQVLLSDLEASLLVAENCSYFYNNFFFFFSPLYEKQKKGKMKTEQ